MKTILKYVLKILKYILIGIGGFAIILLVVYFSFRDEYKLRGPSEFNEIRKLEKENMGSDIIKKLNSSDANSFLINNIPNFNKQESMLVLSWLLNRETDGKYPYYYYAAFCFAKNRDRTNTLHLITLAMLTSRIDCARCADPTSFQVYAILEGSIFSSAIQAFKKSNSFRKRSAKKWALDYEEAMKDRPSLCSQELPKEEWEAKRLKIREEFLSD